MGPSEHGDSPDAPRGVVNRNGHASFFTCGRNRYAPPGRWAVGFGVAETVGQTCRDAYLDERSGASHLPLKQVVRRELLSLFAQACEKHS